MKTKIITAVIMVAMLITTLAVPMSAAESYNWNIANLDFSKFSSVESLPANLKTYCSNPDPCDHERETHLAIENGELKYSPLGTGQTGAANYFLKNVINSGKVVISAKYQAYNTKWGDSVYMYVHATDPTVSGANFGNGVKTTRLLMLAVEQDTGKYFLRGPSDQSVYVFDGLVLPKDSTNRQEVTMVIDLDNGTVELETAGKKDSVTLAELGHTEETNQKMICAVGFGVGWMKSPTIGASSDNSCGYVSYLKIGTEGGGGNADTSDYVMYCGLAMITAVFALSFVAKKKRI